MSNLVKHAQLKWAVLRVGEKVVLRWEAHIHPGGQVIVLDQHAFTPQEATDFAEELAVAVETATSKTSASDLPDEMHGDVVGGRMRLIGDGVSMSLPYDRMVELMKGMESCIAAMDVVEDASSGPTSI